jgi:hypothetical protein
VADEIIAETLQPLTPDERNTLVRLLNRLS